MEYLVYFLTNCTFFQNRWALLGGVCRGCSQWPRLHGGDDEKFRPSSHRGHDPQQEAQCLGSVRPATSSPSPIWPECFRTLPPVTNKPTKSLFYKARFQLRLNLSSCHFSAPLTLTYPKVKSLKGVTHVHFKWADSFNPQTGHCPCLMKASSPKATLAWRMIPQMDALRDKVER